jgi:hypothetical protein
MLMCGAVGLRGRGMRRQGARREGYCGAMQSALLTALCGHAHGDHAAQGCTTCLSRVGMSRDAGSSELYVSRLFFLRATTWIQARSIPERLLPYKSPRCARWGLRQGYRAHTRQSRLSIGSRETSLCEAFKAPCLSAILTSMAAEDGDRSETGGGIRKRRKVSPRDTFLGDAGLVHMRAPYLTEGEQGARRFPQSG